MAHPSEPATPRRRDPDRRARILAAAAALAARRGFHAVAMDEIGSEAGIVGSGVYRHFNSKQDILVALLDQAMARLQSEASDILAAAPDDRTALSLLVRAHIAVAMHDRDVLTVYHREAYSLPDADRRRLRREQRHYIEEWVAVLGPLRPELADGELRLLVHAAIGAVQATLFYRSGLAPDRLTELLDITAHACLGVGPTTDRRSEPELTNS